MDKTRKTACAYYRTSSATNVTKQGDAPEDQKDSLLRQQDAVRAYAAANNIEIVKEYYDAAVSGTVFVGERPAFSDMLEYMLGNGARMVLVENVTRFARDVVVQITGHELLKDHGIELVPVDAPGYFTEESPTADMIREVFAVIAKFERASLVLKMRKGRDRKRKLIGRCEGRKPPAQDHVIEAKRLAADGISLRAIATAMAAKGMRQIESKAPYHPGSIKRMIDGHYDE